MNYQSSALIESYLNWWADAGLEVGVSDSPTVWSNAIDAAHKPAVSTEVPVADAPPSQPLPAYPHDLTAFDAWMRENGAKIIPAWGRDLVLPTGPANPPVMLVTDYPEADDIAAGRLFAGEQGALVSAMLSAIGLDVHAQRVASVSLARPVERRLLPEQAALLLPLIRHQIAIVRPRLVLLLGGATAGMLLGDAQMPQPQDQPFINQEGAKMVLFSVHHPRMMLSRPHLKRHAWDVLQLMRERL